MYEDYLNSIDTLWSKQKDKKTTCLDKFKSIKGKNSEKEDSAYVDYLKETNNFCNINASEAEKIGLSPGRYPDDIKNHKKNDKDSIYYKAYPLVNEFVYYKQNRFVDAWYMDNLGSFLIVIERKRR